LVIEPFQRLIQQGELTTFAMKASGRAWTRLRRKRVLEDLQARGNPPWEVWGKRRKSA
jgi:hypothetical protein